MPVIAAGRIRFPSSPNDALASRQVDFVAIGRGVSRRPEWVSEGADGRAARDPSVHRRSCRTAAARTGSSPARSTRAPDASRNGGPVRAQSPKRVVVAGGGPGGLEAARVAAESGHDVVLYEQSDVSGGQLRDRRRRPDPRRVPGLRRLSRARARASRRRCPARIPRRRASPSSPTRRISSSPRPAPRRCRRVPVDAAARVVTVWDLLGGTVDAIPARAAVLDDGSGFWHGISAAEYLAEHGVAVELLTPARGVGLAIPHESLPGDARAAARQRRPLPYARQRDRRAGTTISLARRRRGRAVETDADLLVVRTQLRRTMRWCPARRRGPRARLDRRLLLCTPADPRGARREPRAAALRRRPARECRDGGVLTAEFWRMGATPVPSRRSTALRASSRRRLGRSRRRRGARPPSRPVRRPRGRGGCDDDAEGRHRRRRAASPSAPRGRRDGDAAVDLGRPRVVLARPRRRRDEGAAAEAAARCGLRRVPPQPAGLPPPRAGRDRRRRLVDVAARRHRPVARAADAARQRRCHRPAHDRASRRDTPTVSASPSAPTSTGCATRSRSRRTHAVQAGRDPASLALGCYVQVALTDDEDDERARGDPRPRRHARALLRLRGEAGRGRRAREHGAVPEGGRDDGSRVPRPARRRRSAPKAARPARSISIRARRAPTS